MIRYVLAKGSKIREGTTDFALPRKNELLFLLSIAPSDAEINSIVKKLKINKDLFMNFAHMPYSRRLSITPFAFLFKDYYVEKNAIKVSNSLFVVKENLMVIVTANHSDYYNQLFESSSEKLRSVKANSIGDILYNFLLEDIEDNYLVLEKTEQSISKIENEVAEARDDHNMDVRKIINLKRKLFRISRQFSASIKILTALRTGSAHVKLDGRSVFHLGDLHETFLHQIDVANSQKETISDVLTIHSVNISNKLTKTSYELNIIMKRLAAFALILMLPTWLTGVYGMNFVLMPLINHPNGFYASLVVMLGMVLVVALFFRGKKWL